MARASRPIQRRLMAMMLLTSAAGIVFACAALVVFELVTWRSERLAEVATLARIVAANSTAALAFGDEQDAREVLATLRTEPQVVAAALYDADGVILARYATARAPEQSYPQTLGSDGYAFSFARLEGYEPVQEHRDRRLGTLYIRSDTSALFEQLFVYAIVAATAIGGSLLLAYALSRVLHSRISQPVTALTEIARAVSERADFSVRAPIIGEEEFVLLTSAFNGMLARIESQNAALTETLRTRAEAEHRLQDQLARLDLLQRTTRAIGERQDLESIFQVILRNLEDNLPIDFGCICLTEEGSRRLTVASVGLRSAAMSRALSLAVGREVPVTDNGLAQCMRGRLMYEPDTSEVAFPLPRAFAATGLRSLVAAPLLVESEVFGVLLAARAGAEGFTSGDCEFLRQLSEHVALAAHQVNLYTKLQQAYRDLQESQVTILQQERLRALGQMASGIAHDINNAISPITLYTESLLEREPDLSQRARDSLRVIQRAIDDVGQTVARMREFYRQREPASDLVALELKPIVEQVIALTRARWSDVPQERGVVVNVETDLPEQLPAVLGTESDIRDALTNLIFNAVDAMPQGGTLTLRTRRAAPEHGEAVELEVVDTGAGMDEDTRRRCLEPFFTTKGERGTGMGLAMVYGMVQRHGAQIEIDSEPGRGTTMRLRFTAAQTVSGPQVREPARVVRPLRLLVIDDDPLVTESLAHVLHADGHIVQVADGGQAGIDAFGAARHSGEIFDVVMTDLGMPYVDGRAVAAAIKTLSPRTPVILLTGWGQRLATEQSVPEHVDRLLAKPPKIAELRHVLAALVETEETLRDVSAQ